MSVETNTGVTMPWIKPEYILGESGEKLNATPIMVTNSLTRTKVYY